MKGLVYEGPKNVVYADVPDPVIVHDRDIIVAVKACSICGSDLHVYNGDTFTDHTGYCIGHEAVGEVVEMGKGVLNRRIGERVMISAAVGCGSCRQCRAARPLLCETAMPQCYGLSNDLQGSQAEAVRVPVGDFNAAPIPAGLSDEQALMLTDAAATAWYGCELARISPGSDVAVIGLGPIGLMAIENAFVLGAARVFAIDPVPERRSVAQSLGAVPLSPENAAEEIREATNGRMLTNVLEAAGSSQALSLALTLPGRQQNVASIGVNLATSFDFPIGPLFLHGINLAIGTCSVPYYWPTLVPLIQQGRLDPAQFITDRFDLSQGVEAYAAFDRRSAGCLKTVLYP
ncbi:alcohol dehydrogenase catalytic domain-containing protein [Novosphingobium cyanobacteriorum]|uniref:Alcohol dehydrogenase catalytic domain-containing protein n=1 Tax=Novosphingobium cyanobacteriorum TaxID=3024215 RepID=A0ABT6CJ07_9SPHN|nr:alcohol dehydrogenase catalytic domain-containing protein [Novosphingobium cyanobacteriorum]MDF8333807.1 alcohol dehydrogenase catalytic domain-containing protein [Novosphingobium cyanobacteriorum]